MALHRMARRAHAPGRRAFLTGTAALLLARPAFAAEADFLLGETLRILIPNSAGSASDRTARLFCKYLANRLPDTRLAIQNLTQANGRLAMLETWNAPADGLTLTFPSANLVYSDILGEEDLPFSLLDFAWVGGLSQDRRALLLGAKSSAADLDDLLRGDRPLLLASEGTNSGTYVSALLLNALLGVWLRPVTGYNANARALALLNGEADCLMGTLEAMAPLIEAGTGRLVLRFGDFDLPARLGTAPTLAEVPHDPDFAWIIDLIGLQGRVGRTIAAPPATPADRLAVLRALFLEVVADPGFLAEAETAALAIDVSDGATVAATMRSLLADKAETAARLRWALDCGQRRADSGTRC